MRRYKKMTLVEHTKNLLAHFSKIISVILTENVACKNPLRILRNVDATPIFILTDALSQPPTKTIK